MSFRAPSTRGGRRIWMRGACSATRSTRASYCMANPRRVHTLLDMADEDLAGARGIGQHIHPSRPLSRPAECREAVKALLERRDLNPGREHRFESLAEMLPLNDLWRSRIQSLDSLSPAATS